MVGISTNDTDRAGDHSKNRYLDPCTAFTSFNQKSTPSVEGKDCDRGRN